MVGIWIQNLLPLEVLLGGTVQAATGQRSGQDAAGGQQLALAYGWHMDSKFVAARSTAWRDCAGCYWAAKWTRRCRWAGGNSLL
jgi:hypothetical protein